MAAPGWLTTDPDPVRLPKRTRPGWAPRPDKKVALVHGWAKPEEMGAGQSLVSGAEGAWEEPWVPPTPGPPAEPTPQPVVAEPTPNLTPPPEPDILSPEAGTSVPTRTASPASRGVLSGGTAGTTAARAGVVSGAKAPPPQGPPSAPRPTGTSSNNPFVQDNIAAAKRVSARTGVPWQVLLAIPGNETGWGKAVAGNNYFGIKGSNPKTGANTGSVGTWEVVNGQRVNIKDTFRAYSGYEESAEDFAQFLKDNPRYAKALQHLDANPDDWRGFVRKVHEAGYATDPEWSNKIINIGNGIGDDGSPVPGSPGAKVNQSRAVLKSDVRGRRGVQSVIDVGMTAMGSKYAWGGAGGRTSFEEEMAPTDCSGFVAWAYQRATGHKLTAYTGSMWDQTRDISADQAAPGDLVFYNMGKGAGQQHVGIYVGNGKMLHDSSVNPNGGVDITPLWGNPSFKRVEGVDPSQASYGSNPELARVRAKARAQRANRETLNPEEWTKFVPEQEFVPDQPEMLGAGQDTAVQEETEEQRRQREEAERLRAEEEERQRREIEEAQRAQAEAEALAQTPQPEPEKNPFEHLVERAKEILTPRQRSNEEILNPPTPQPSAAEQIGGAVQGALEQLPARGTVERQLRGEENITIPSAPITVTTPDTEIGRTPEVTIPGQVAGVAGVVGEATGGPSETHPAGGPVRPLAGGGRYAEGATQLTREFEQRTGVPYSEFEAMYDNPDQHPQLVELEGTWNELVKGTGGAPGQGTYEAYGRAPEEAKAAVEGTATAAELLGGLALLPGDVAMSGPGLARAGAALAIDPSGIPFVAGSEAIRGGAAAARALRGADNVVRAVDDAAQARRVDDIKAVNPNLANVPDGDEIADGLALLQDLNVITRKGGGPTADNVRRGGQLLGVLPDEARAARREVEVEAARAAGVTEDMLEFGESAEDLARFRAQRAAERSTRVEELAQQAVKQSVPEQAGLDTEVADALRRPLDPQEEINILQTAFVHLNDAGLETGAAELSRLLTTGGHLETQTGAQIRRLLINTISNKYPMLRPDHVLNEVDTILRQAGKEGLTAAAAIRGGVAPPDDLLKASAAWYGSDLARATDDLLRRRALEAARRAAGIPGGPPPVPPTAAGRAGGAASGGIPSGAGRAVVERGAYGLAGAVSGWAGGAAAEGAFDDPRENPNDDAYWPWRAVGAMAGLQLGLIGGPQAVGLVGKTWDAGVVRNFNHFFAPMENRTPEAKALFAEWTGLVNLARQKGTLLTEQVRGAWGGLDNAETLAFIEANGRLPDELRGDARAEAALQTWKDIGAWARKFGVIDDPISLTGKAKIYVPHVVDAEWKAAKEKVGKIHLGGAYESQQRSTRQIGSNPFWHYTKPREHETLYEGMANKVVYTDNVAEAMGTYYQRAIEKMANARLAKRLEELAAKNDPNILKRIERQGLSGEDVIRRALDDPSSIEGGRRLKELGGFFAGKDLDEVVVSKELYNAFKNLVGDETRIWQLPGFRQAFIAQSFLRQSILSGIDALQLMHASNAIFNTRNSVTRPGAKGGVAARVGEWKFAQGDAIDTWLTGMRFFFKPTAHRQWKEMPASGERMMRALKDGVNLVSTDRPDDLDSHKLRWAQAMFNGVVGFGGGYTTTLAAGGSQDEAFRNALLTGAVGATTGAPMFGNRFKGPGIRVGQDAGFGWGPEQMSLMKAASDGLWDRALPFWKLTIYETYRDVLSDARTAAEFTNQIFGGQNIQAIARSRNVQDFMRMAMMTPDWYEGFARSIGSLPITGGDKATLGHLNRVYWMNTVIGAAVAHEALNLALGGQWSWQNDPDKVLSVNVSNLYRLGRFAVGNTLGKETAEAWWPEKDHLGRPVTPYWDFLGPFRGLFEPFAETARWAMAGAYNATGIEADDLPLSQEVYGSFERGIRAPDPARAWGDFVRARTGWIPSTAMEIASNRDHMGKPLDREEDGFGQQVVNRVWFAMQNMLQAGTSDVTRNLARGEGGPATLYGLLTGHRVERETPATRQWQQYEHWAKDAGISDEKWREKREDARAVNEDVDKEIEAILAGKKNQDGSDMTSRQRLDAIERQGDRRQSIFRQRYDLLAHVPEGVEKDELKKQLQVLQKYDTVMGGDVPSDLAQRADLDLDSLITEAWMRDPKEIARLQGKAPEPANFLDALGQGARTVIERTEPGFDEKRKLAEMRGRWLAEVADEHDIDQAVLQDLIKAHVYEVTDAEGDFSPPVIPGVSSENLDRMVDEWRARGFDEHGNPVPNAQILARDRKTYVLQQAQALGVDPEALAQRIKLRNMPLVDATPNSLGQSHANDVLNQSRMFDYVDERGNPRGTPEDWQDWDEAIDKAKADRYTFKESEGRGYFYKGTAVDWDLTNLLRDKERAQAFKYRDILNSEHAEDYYRWYGDGANMTDAQWQKYTSGTLEMWQDKPSPQEAKNRNEAMRLWAALTYDERQKYGVASQNQPPIRWEGRDEYGTMAPRRTSLAGYIQYINTYKVKDYVVDKDGKRTPLLGDIDPGSPVPVS